MLDRSIEFFVLLSPFKIAVLLRVMFKLVAASTFDTLEMLTQYFAY